MKTAEPRSARRGWARSLFLSVAAFAILTVAALTISRAQLQSPSVWPMFQHDLGHTGLSQFDTSGNPGLLRWSFETTPFGNPVYGSPAIAADGTVYIGSGVDTNLSVSYLWALNPNSTATCSGGANVNCPTAQKWKFVIPGSGSTVESSPAIASDGTIYVGSDNHNLYAVNPNGTEKWVFGTGNEVTSSPAIGADGTIYVGSQDGALYALTDGGQNTVTEKWLFGTGGPIQLSSPAIGADGTIYVGSDDNKLYAVNPNGTQKWAFVTGSSVPGSPVIGPDGTIYVGSDDLNLYALTDGGQNTVTKKWAFATSGRPSPAIGPNGTVYVLDGVANLYSLTDNGTSYTQNWVYGSGNFEIPGSPAIGADGTIYFGGDNALVYAVTDNGSSATEKWAAESGDTIFPSPAIGANGTVYIGQASGYLVAILAPPTTAVVPASLVMGNSPVGDTVTKNLTIKNTGHTNSLYFGSMTSSDPAEFAVGTSTCPAGGLAPQTSCTIPIAFTPGSLGPHTATLTVNDSLATSPQHVALSGTGTVDMTVAPTSYAFGSVKDGSKAVKVIVVHNYQTNPVSLGESFSGANAGDFSVTGGTCTSTLAAKTVCTLIVTFAPTALGTESATMTVTDSPDPLGPYMVSFTASADIPETVSPTSLHFANVYQSASKTLSVTVTNHSTADSITLSGTTISGANSGDFAVTGGTCTGTLAASSNCTYAVTFTPSTETAESGTLSIGVAEDPNGGPPAIGLSGTGVTPVTVVPASIAFGTVAGGHSSVNRTVTVYNYGGASVSLSDSVTGPNASDFMPAGGTCGATLAGGGAHCTYLLKFTPSIVGSESATLGVSASGDAASPHNVSLTGTGS